MSFNEWKEVNLGDVSLKITKGTTPSTIKRGFVDSGISFFKSECLTDKKLIDKSKETYIDEETHEKMSRSQLQEDDVLLSMAGAYLGKIALVTKDDVPSNINQAIALIRLNHSEAYSQYIYYYLSQKNVVKYINSVSSQSAQPNINLKQIGEIPVKLPPIEEQISIAKILSDLDNKIEVNNKINQRLEDMAQSIFKHWFVDFEFPNEEGKPYKSSGGEMVESELGMIPKGWDVVRFGDLIEKIIDNRGKTPKTEAQGYRLVEGFSINMGDSFIDKEVEKQKYVSEDTYNTWFRSGHPQYLDILCATVGTLPKWCFTNKNEKICIAQNIIGIRSNRDIASPYYLKLYMDTREFIGAFNGRIVTTAQPSIKVGHMEDIKVLLPSKTIINKLDSVVENIYRKIENNNYQVSKITNIRDTLLPKLMSGEIRVPVDK